MCTAMKVDKAMSQQKDTLQQQPQELKKQLNKNETSCNMHKCTPKTNNAWRELKCSEGHKRGDALQQAIQEVN